MPQSIQVFDGDGYQIPSRRFHHYQLILCIQIFKGNHLKSWVGHCPILVRWDQPYLWLTNERAMAEKFRNTYAAKRFIQLTKLWSNDDLPYVPHGKWLRPRIITVSYPQ